jgi:hypothetical protein
MNLTILSFRSGMARSWQGTNPESNSVSGRWWTVLLAEPVLHDNPVRRKTRLLSILLLGRLLLTKLPERWGIVRVIFIDGLKKSFLDSRRFHVVNPPA